MLIKGLVMDINDGRFSMNGGCGYVLKPNFIRDDVGLYFASNIFFISLIEVGY